MIKAKIEIFLKVDFEAIDSENFGFTDLRTNILATILTGK
jgi:hypothetical protein